MLGNIMGVYGSAGLQSSAVDQCYKAVRSNVISVTRRWGGVQFTGKKVLRNPQMTPKKTRDNN